MIEFLDAALSFPTLVWTVLLACVFMFWAIILTGGFGLHIFEGHGGPDFDAHMDVDAHVEADAHIEAHTDVEATGDVEGHAAHDAHGAGHGWMGSIFGWMGVGSVPITIVFSILIIEGWLLSMLTDYAMSSLNIVLIHSIAWGSALLIVTFFVAASVTGLTTRPLRGLFKTHNAIADESLIDQICVVRTTSVTARSGQAEFKMDGAPLILSVRCSTENDLKRGDEAVIVSYDKTNNTYEITAFDPKKMKPRV